MSTLDAWREITQSEAVVGFFRGLFERAGVRVLDRNEAFTCIHRGDRVEFEPTLDVSTVDFTVDVTSDQVDRLAEHARSGAFDAVEQFRIVSTLLTPATDGTLRNPILSNGLVRRLATVQVELEEGPIVTSNLLDVAPDDVAIGLPVRAVFEKVNDDVTLLYFARAE